MFYCDICEHLREGSIFTPVIKKILSCKFPPISNLVGYSAVRNQRLQEILIINPRFKSLWIVFVFKINGRYRQILKVKYPLFLSLFLPELSLYSRYTNWKKYSSTEETVSYHYNHYRINSGKRVTTKALVRFWGIRGKKKKIQMTCSYVYHMMKTSLRFGKSVSTFSPLFEAKLSCILCS